MNMVLVVNRGSCSAPAATANALRISSPASRIAMLVSPTDEELMIEVARVLDHRIRHTMAVLSERGLAFA